VHPQIPGAEFLQKILSSACLERHAVAQNPTTPLNALKVLAKDGKLSTPLLLLICCPNLAFYS